jgi:ATP-binding cassette subfamily B protein
MNPPRTTDADNKGDTEFQWQTLKTLSHYLWPAGQLGMKIRVVTALVLLVLAKLAEIYSPQIWGQIIDGLGGKADLIVLPVLLIIGFGLLRILSIAFAELRDAVFAKVGQRAIRTVALQTFRHLHNLALRYHLDRQTGGLTRSIERGTKGIDFLLNFMLFNILPTLFQIVVVCVVLWALYGFWYSLVTFVTVGGYIVFTIMVTEWRIKFRRQMNESDNTANTRAIDSLLNYETVKYFGNEEHEASRFDRSLETYERAAVLSKTSLSLLNIGQAVFVGGGLTIIMLMAGNAVSDGTMTVGEFSAVFFWMLQLFMPLNFLGFVYREIKQSLIDMEAMFSLLRVGQEIADPPGAPPLRTGAGELVFDSVSFGYDSRRGILHDVSFTVPAGKTIAVVGSSGAGKSTIARLMFRFYDVTGGAIRIDGQDIRDVTQESVRAAIGIVPQDTVLFNDTIYYNIAYGRPDATPSEIEEAARLASVHDFITRMPDGYQTIVGERGLKLSGGEKQRVAIARTILKQPAILVFDEATSALDTRTEREIQAALKTVSADRTTLVIAHRLSTIVDADEIIVLDHGRIAERGRHDALLAQDGMYAAMWQRQQEAGPDADIADALPNAEPEPA